MESSSTINNILGNPGFENAIGSGTESNWDATNGATRITVRPDVAFVAFPAGAARLFVEDGEFTFQVVNGIHPGDLVTFSGSSESDIDPDNSPASCTFEDGTTVCGGKMAIEFKKINPDGSDSLISRVLSGVINNATAATYETFQISAVAPAGTRSRSTSSRKKPLWLAHRASFPLVR